MLEFFLAVFRLLIPFLQIFTACFAAVMVIAGLGMFFSLVWEQKIIILVVGAILALIDWGLIKMGGELPWFLYIIVIVAAIAVVKGNK